MSFTFEINRVVVIFKYRKLDALHYSMLVKIIFENCAYNVSFPSSAINPPPPFPTTPLLKFLGDFQDLIKVDSKFQVEWGKFQKWHGTEIIREQELAT